MCWPGGRSAGAPPANVQVQDDTRRSAVLRQRGQLPAAATGNEAAGPRGDHADVAPRAGRRLREATQVETVQANQLRRAAFVQHRPRSPGDGGAAASRRPGSARRAGRGPTLRHRRRHDGDAHRDSWTCRRSDGRAGDRYVNRVGPRACNGARRPADGRRSSSPPAFRSRCRCGRLDLSRGTQGVGACGPHRETRPAAGRVGAVP
jgi:hypothetical protein